MMAYSYLLNGICSKVLLCGLDERLLMLIPLPTTVSPTSPAAGRFFIVLKIRSYPAAASPLVFAVKQ